MVSAFLLATSVFAAPPGGFTVDSGLPVTTIGIRSALALAPRSGQWVSQTTVSGRYAAGRTAAIYGQLPWVITGSSGPDDTSLGSGVGQMRIGLVRPVSPADHVTLAVGGEVGVPVGYEWLEMGWVEAPYTAQRGADALAVAQGTLAPPDRTAVTVRLAGGWRWSPDLPELDRAGRHRAQLEAALALVVPTGGGSALVVEGKGLSGPTPADLLSAVRVVLPEQMAVDVGVHLMVGAPQEGKVASGPVVQLRQVL